MFSPDCLRPVVFDGILGRHLGNSSKDGLPLCPPTGLSEERGKGSFGQALFKSVKSTHTRHFPFFFFTTMMLANHLG